METNQTFGCIIDVHPHNDNAAAWQIEEITGYQPLTDVWEGLTAREYNTDILMTHVAKLFHRYKDNGLYQELTELVMVLNWKMWQMYDRGNEELQDVYCAAFKYIDDWCKDNLQGEQLEYYYRTTD